MNRIRVRPIRSRTERIQAFAVEVFNGVSWREHAAFKTFDVAMTRAHRLPVGDLCEEW